VDVSTLFSDDIGSAAGGAPANDVTSTDGDDNDDLANDDTATPVMPDPNAPTGKIGDPLADVDDPTTSSTPTTPPTPPADDDIVPNETITTNDWSKVGEIKRKELPMEDLPPIIIPTQPLPPPKEPEIPQAAEITPEQLITPEAELSPEIATPEVAPEVMPEITPGITPETASEVPPFASELKFKLPGIDDPEKAAFVKTYTEEFDDARARAISVVKSILDAIDKAVHEHSPDITIPNTADEFLAKKPADNKVEKFDDAREIVNEVLARAADAKAQAAQAAEEAARIYDEVQTFKKETEEQIALLAM